MLGQLFTILAAFLAFAVATWRARMEVTIVKYPNTYFLLRKCRSLYEYIIINGIFALVLYGLIVSAVIPIAVLVPAGAPAWVSAIFGAPVWIIALMVGWNTKKFLRLAISSLRGFDSMSMIARKEENLLNQIDSTERAQVNFFIQGRLPKYQTYDIGMLRENVRRIVPVGGSNRRHREGLNRARDIQEIMRICLRAVGRETFDQAFPFP